jgi:hypothetical protein
VEKGIDRQHSASWVLGSGRHDLEGAAVRLDARLHSCGPQTARASAVLYLAPVCAHPPPAGDRLADSSASSGGRSAGSIIPPLGAALGKVTLRRSKNN